MSISDSLFVAKAAFEVSKEAIDLCDRPNLDRSKIRERLLELQQLILSAQAELFEADNERRQLAAELDLRKSHQALGSQFISDQGTYWIGAYPYCPNCWEIERKPMRLSGPFYHGKGVTCKWTCPAHNSTFFLKHRAAGNNG